MSNPVFPNAEQLLTVLMQEIPQGVYADDRADNQDFNQRSYSSSELRAIATTLAKLYQNLGDIWENKWISTVNTDALNNWNSDLFTTLQDASLPTISQQGNLLAKFRQTGSIAKPAIESLISGILTPLGLSFELLAFSAQYDGTMYSTWVLTGSQLCYDSFLGIQDPLIGTGLGSGETPLDCSLDYTAAGITLMQEQEIQLAAYGYTVLIFGVASASTLALLDALLSQAEPARSKHFIINNAVPGPSATLPDLTSNILDGGPPGANYLLDSIDFGLQIAAPSTYDVLDFND